MKIKKFSFEDNRWDEFCYESDDCWFFHTSDFTKYVLEYSGKDDVELLSFYIEDKNNDILAICPLIRYKNNLTFFGHNAPNPAIRNGLSFQLSNDLMNQIFSEINRIAQQLNIEKNIMTLTPLSKNVLNLFTYNYLMKYGYENTSLNTQILVLDKDERILWSEIKKSHRYEINKGEEMFEFLFLKPFETNRALFDEFKNLHFLAAGMKTRSDLTWDYQFEWISKGNGLLVLAVLDGKPIGGIYSLLYKDGAYYAVSANHPDYDELSISHAIQWQIIKYLKVNRFKYYELGLQQFSNQPYDTPTEKDINISLFKRHFGGYTVTFHRGQKTFKSKI